MVQLQALNYILKNKDTDLLCHYDEKYFFNYEKEYKFLKEHFVKTGEIVDIIQMLDHFPGFTVFPDKTTFLGQEYSIMLSKTKIEEKLFGEYVFHFTKSFFDTHNISDSKVKEDFIEQLKQIKQP